MKLYCLILILYQIVSSSSLQCKDENNKDVDWYVMYKLPHEKKGTDNKLIKHGVAYLYLTSNEDNNIDMKWIFSNKSVNDTDSLLGNTLKPLYSKQNTSDILHILYNDEPPNKSKKSSKGHTKGIVLGDEEGGIWIVHSVPLFPILEKYVYPSTGAIFGQSVLCISFDSQNLNNIGTQLLYNEPEIYSSNIPINLTLKYPQLKTVIDDDSITNPPWFHTLNITSRNGVNFISFAKTKNFAKDLYLDFVAPALKTRLLVETWPNSPGRLRSNCTTHYSVMNVKSINLEVAGIIFKSSSDHSKWAVGNDTESNWICIGDINRAVHQEHRGGGTVCLNNIQLANLYKKCVYQIETCANLEVLENSL